MRLRGAALAVFVLLGTAVAFAERAAADAPTLVRLSANADELHTARTEALARRVESLLTALPEVVAARAELTLPRVDAVALDRPLPRPRAVIVVRSRAKVEADVRRAVESLLGAAVELTVIERSERAPEPLRTVRLGPFTVASESRTPLTLALVGLLTSNALLALLLAWRTRRARRATKGDRAESTARTES